MTYGIALGPNPNRVLTWSTAIPDGPYGMHMGCIPTAVPSGHGCTATSGPNFGLKRPDPRARALLAVQPVALIPNCPEAGCLLIGNW